MRIYACTTVSLGGVRPWVHEFVCACVHECVTMGMIVEHVSVSVCVCELGNVAAIFSLLIFVKTNYHHF